MPITTRGTRNRGPEKRTRTGCRKCRLRRVKCPEQKPICTPCQTLGFTCSYETKLRWQPVSSYDSSPALSCLRIVEDWMFLSTFPEDFDLDRSPQLLYNDGFEDDKSSISDEELVALERTKGISQIPLAFGNSTYHVDILPELWTLQLSPAESHLWTYFHKAIAPTCILNPAINPYQDIILRIAAFTGNTSPLFHAIMAISASQLYILGNESFYYLSWHYRQRALRSLRLETVKMEQGAVDQPLEAQILATVMAMVFLDILSDCSASWVVHANFARALIHKLRENYAALDRLIQQLLNFVGGYIVVHEVYAHTAWNAEVTEVSGGQVVTMCDDSNLETLTGCSTEFFQVLADVNTLATDYSRYYQHDYADSHILTSLEHRRHHLETQLESYKPDMCLDEPGIDVPASVLILETKRLTALLHLYSRVDHLGPYDDVVSDLALRILRLVARIPSRSNLILWPLFMVATLGIGSESDSERAFILQKIDGLQRERQMRYIKKARCIITEVWKIRDLREADNRLGWDILQQVAQLERISLF